MEHPILMRIRREAFEPLAWFASQTADPVPEGVRFVLLIGNAGPQMFRRFANECDPVVDSLDGWTRGVVDAIAHDLGALAAYPFDSPFQPFLSWARRGGGGYASPLGLNIHPIFGLWHAYRAALLFPVPIDLPHRSAGDHPCEGCRDKPCLQACPVSAFDAEHFDVHACERHLSRSVAQTCDPGGCKARRACPIGTAFRYEPAQMAFHMRAFRAARAARSV